MEQSSSTAISFFALALAFGTLTLYTFCAALNAHQKRQQVKQHMADEEIQSTSTQYKVNPGNKAVTFYVMSGLAFFLWTVGFSYCAATFVSSTEVTTTRLP